MFKQRHVGQLLQTLPSGIVRVGMDIIHNDPACFGIVVQLYQIFRVHKHMADCAEVMCGIFAGAPYQSVEQACDDDTVMGGEALDTARYAAGAVVSAIDMVMRGDAYHAFCAVRPPGHHAQSGQAGGFCLINNAAVGAMYAIARFRLTRVAIIDFDVHYGDGTAEIFKDDSRVLFLNSYEQGLFPFPDSGNVQNISDYAVNLAFPAGSGSLDFRKAVREQWLPKLSAFQPELVLLSSGFDGHKLDETGRLNLRDADYAWLTHKIIQTASSYKGKIVSVLEGGYTLV